MRVNMDSSVVSDPRFKMLGKALGVTWREALGSCFLVWLACYERREDMMPEDEIDVAAECEGFAKAMLRVGLAHPGELDGTIVIHGVDSRISFLNKQRSKGKAGGAKSGKARQKPEN